MIRYADDFVVTGHSEELLKTAVKPLIESFLLGSSFLKALVKAFDKLHMVRALKPLTGGHAIGRNKVKHARRFSQFAKAEGGVPLGP